MAREMTEELLTEMAIYYIQNDISIDELARKNGFEKSVLVKYFNRKRTITLPYDLQQKVNEKKENNWIEGKSTYGNFNKKVLSKKQIKEAAIQYFAKKKSIEELAKKFGVSKITLYNHIFTVDILGETIYWNVKQQEELSKHRRK